GRAGGGGWTEDFPGTAYQFPFVAHVYFLSEWTPSPDPRIPETPPLSGIRGSGDGVKFLHAGRDGLPRRWWACRSGPAAWGGGGRGRATRAVPGGRRGPQGGSMPACS